MRQQLFVMVIMCGLFSCKSSPHSTLQVKKINKVVSIESLIQKFDSINDYNYKIDQSWKGSVPQSVNGFSALCSFTKFKDDSIAGSHYYLNMDNLSMVYNGDTFIYADSVKKSVLIYKLSEYPNPRSRVTQIMPYYLSYNELMVDLKKRFHSKPQTIKLLTDTIINNIESARIKIIVNDSIINKNHKENYKIITFDKSTLLPLIVTAINRTPGEMYEEQIVEAKFSSFVINTTPVDKTYDISLIPFHIQKISYYQSNRVSPALKVNDKAPEWRGILVNGDSISVKDQVGKITLLNFTSVNCGYCLKANEVLNKIDEKYKNSKLRVISVYSIDKLAAINYLVEKSKISHLVIYNAVNMQKDYLIDGYPNLFLIGPSGRIEYLSLGFSDSLERDLSRAIDRLLN